MFNFRHMLGFIWALPITAIGLAYVSLFTFLGWYKRLGQFGDAYVWQSLPEKSPKWLNKAWSRWGGQAIGNIVVLKYDVATDRGRVVLRHEQEHVHQCMVLGVFQPIVYGILYLVLMTSRHAHPYYDHPFEIDARRAAGQVIDVVGALKRAAAEGKLRLSEQK